MHELSSIYLAWKIPRLAWKKSVLSNTSRPLFDPHWCTEQAAVRCSIRMWSPRTLAGLTCGSHSNSCATNVYPYTVICAWGNRMLQDAGHRRRRNNKRRGRNKDVGHSDLEDIEIGHIAPERCAAVDAQGHFSDRRGSFIGVRDAEILIHPTRALLYSARMLHHPASHRALGYAGISASLTSCPARPGPSMRRGA